MLKVFPSLKSSFSTPQQNTKIPLSHVKEVTYRDCRQIERTHLVYQKQTPLPELLKKYLEKSIQTIINNIDYCLELDINCINRTLKYNLLSAMSHVNNGEDYLFEQKMEREPNTHALNAKEGRFAFDLNERLIAIDYKTENGSGIAASKGMKHTMEDTFLTDTVEMKGIGKQAKILGVFDGHGGAECAEHVKDTFVSCFQKRFEELTQVLLDYPTDVIIYNALNFTFADISRLFQKPVGGTTASICLIIDRDVWVANTGDTRTSLVTHNQIIPLSVDQRPCMPKHKEMIESRGAYVNEKRNTVCHRDAISSIAPARSIGDHQMRGGMCSLPEISKISLTSSMRNAHLIQASDGIYHVASTNQVGTLVKRNVSQGLSPARNATEVAETALRTISKDNVTILITPLDVPPPTTIFHIFF